MCRNHIRWVESRPQIVTFHIFNTKLHIFMSCEWKNLETFATFYLAKLLYQSATISLAHNPKKFPGIRAAFSWLASEVGVIVWLDRRVIFLFALRWPIDLEAALDLIFKFMNLFPQWRLSYSTSPTNMTSAIEFNVTDQAFLFLLSASLKTWVVVEVLGNFLPSFGPLTHALVNRHTMSSAHQAKFCIQEVWVSTTLHH